MNSHYCQCHHEFVERAKVLGRSLVNFLRNVPLILFGALVLAIGMSAMAKFLTNRARIGYGAAVAIVVIFGLIIIGEVGWFFGATIDEQLDEVSRKIPAGLKLPN